MDGHTQIHITHIVLNNVPIHTVIHTHTHTPEPTDTLRSSFKMYPKYHRDDNYLQDLSLAEHEVQIISW